MPRNMGELYLLLVYTPVLTCLRPPPVSPPTAIEREFGFIQKSLPLPEVPTHSDLEGLNLNITVPSGLKPGSKLPVYVWIHGGGFAVGSSWYPHYNASPLVKLSAKKDQPIIGVSVK
jgi:acetyl esterase/lipase